jgi:hypothetical protein
MAITSSSRLRFTDNDDEEELELDMLVVGGKNNECSHKRFFQPWSVP